MADVDARWNVIVAAVDDRTEGELGKASLDPNERRLKKSRYDSVSTYISNKTPDELNDIELSYDQDIVAKLTAAEVPILFAKHIASLFVRDALVIFEDDLEQDNEVSNDHFENLQSTNWQSLRIKPPPPQSNIGWRVEFRTMEIQITDFENAAFSVFMILLIGALRTGKFSLQMPISMVDDNLAKSQMRNAVRDGRFRFAESTALDSLSTGLYTIDEIMNRPTHGLITIVNQYLDTLAMTADQRKLLDGYVTFIRGRSTGESLHDTECLS